MQQSFVSFEHVRFLAKTLTQDLDSEDAAAAAKRVATLTQSKLVPDLRRYRAVDERLCMQVAIAVLELCCRLQVEAPPSQLFDLIGSMELRRRKRQTASRSVIAETLALHFETSDVVLLAGWLVSVVGKLLLQRQDSDVSYQGAAIVLDSIMRYASTALPDVDINAFHVTAFDACIARQLAGWTNQHTASLMPVLYTIPTSTKIALLQHDFRRRTYRHEQRIMIDRTHAGQAYMRDGQRSQYVRTLRLHRENLVAETLQGLGGIGDDDNDNNEEEDSQADSSIDAIKVVFVGEDGQDEGGLTKEWLLLLSGELIPSTFEQHEPEARYAEINASCPDEHAFLMGVLLGLVVRLHLVIDVALAPHIHRALLSAIVSEEEVDVHSLHDAMPLDQLRQIRPGLASGLDKLLSWDERQSGLVEGKMAITFSYLDGDANVELIPDGHTTRVTADNRAEYVEALCSYILERRGQRALDMLCRGFRRVCRDVGSLALLTSDEFNRLVHGHDSVPGIEALQAACTVQASGGGSIGVHSDAAYLSDFWRVVAGMSQDDLRRLLHFVTATHRMPLVSSGGGVSAARVSPFTITLLDADSTAPGAAAVDRLPTASTCSNVLYLPRYPSYDVLQRCLLLAIREGNQGFGRP